MTEKTYQVKVTESELDIIVDTLSSSMNGKVDGNTSDLEYEFDRLSYFAKRLIKIRKGEVETDQSIEIDTSAKGWN